MPKSPRETIATLCMLLSMTGVGLTSVVIASEEGGSYPHGSRDVREAGLDAQHPATDSTDAAAEDEGPNVRVNQDSSGKDQMETTIGVNPTDPMNVVGGSIDERDGYWKDAYYHSHDGGHSWEDGLLPLPPDRSGSDPVLSFCGNGSVIYIGLTPSRVDDTGGLWAYRSDDGGRTWPLQQSVVDEMPAEYPVIDKPWLSCDATGSPWANRAYSFCMTKWDETDRDSIRVYVSDDLGETWTAPLTISDTEHTQSGPNSGIGPGGELFVAWLDFTDAVILFDRSLDGGTTFHEDIVVENVHPVTLLGSLHLPHGANSLPLLAVDATAGPHAGNIYIVWTDEGTTDLDILFARSTDGGLTWSDPIRPTGDEAGNNVDQWSGTVAVDPKGRIIVSWLDNRRDPGGAHYETWAAISRDGGTTFDTPFVLSDTLSLGQQGRFIGHYMGVTASADTLWTLWPDMRSGTEVDLFSDPYPNRFDYDEVQGVVFDDDVTLTFEPQDDRFGEDLDYDVLSGMLADLVEDSGYDRVSCLTDDLDAPPLVDERIPDSGTGFYYLVRVDGPSGVGTYGDAAPIREEIRDVLDEGTAGTCP